MGRLRRPLALAAAVLTTSMLSVVGLAGPAEAAPFSLTFSNVTGSTYLAKPKVTAVVPQSVVSTMIDLDTGTITGQIAIPDLTVKLSLAPSVGVTSTVRIVPVGDLSGTIDLAASKLTTTSRFTLRIVEAHLDAAPGVNLVGANCRTTKASTLVLANTTPIDVFAGTTTAGRYGIPSWRECGLLTPLLSLLLSGPDNTMTLILK